MNTVILEETEQGDLPVDVFQKLANDRILFLSDFIDDDAASHLAASLMLKDRESNKDKITLFINSDGGSIRDALMIYDVMQTIEAPLETIVNGTCSMEATLLLVAGTPGMRYATSNSNVSIGQLTHEYSRISDLTDAEIFLRHSEEDNTAYIKIIAKHSNKSYKEVKDDFIRQKYLTPSQAKTYGLIDKIITPTKTKSEKSKTSKTKAKPSPKATKTTKVVKAKKVSKPARKGGK